MTPLTLPPDLLAGVPNLESVLPFVTNEKQTIITQSRHHKPNFGMASGLTFGFLHRQISTLVASEGKSSASRKLITITTQQHTPFRPALIRPSTTPAQERALHLTTVSTIERQITCLRSFTSTAARIIGVSLLRIGVQGMPNLRIQFQTHILWISVVLSSDHS